MPPTSTETEAVTLGEVNRNVSRLSEQMAELTKTVSDRPTWHDLRRMEEATADRHKTLADEVASLRNWQTWAIRAILGALIIGGVGLLFVVKP